MGHDVFISYSSHDKAAADAVCAALEANGVRCWVAPRDIKPGENWATSILRGVADCRMMVLVFSAHANDSQHVRREVERAVHRGIAIAPLRIQDVMPKDDMEYFLSSSHWMDALTPPLQKHLREFTQKVRGLLEIGGAPPGAAPDLSPAVAERRPPAHRRSRAAVLLAAVALLAGVAAAAWVFRGELADRFAKATHHETARRESPDAPVPAISPTPAPASPPAVASPAPAGVAGQSRPSTPGRGPLSALQDLFLADHITAEQYQLGQVLLKADPALLDDYDSARRTQFAAVLDGKLAPDKLAAALSAIESPQAKAARLAREQAQAKETLRQDRIGMKLTRIEPGEFLMGSPANEDGRFDNETQHKVKLTKPFFLGTYHVTRGQFAAFVKDAAYRTDAEKDGWAYAYNGTMFGKVDGASWLKPGFDQTDDHPVVEVSWNDAQAFCQWLSKKEGGKYRLPSEAEWEYACRAGTHTAYFWGDDPDGGQGFANCADLTAKDKLNLVGVFNWRDGFAYTSPVGSFKPNPWGLYDIIGNAWEWCSDYYGPYGEGDAVDPAGPAQGDTSALRVLRGGSWGSGPRNYRAAYRFKNAPANRSFIIGFRVCLDF